MPLQNIAAVMSIPGTAGSIRSAETLGGRAAVADEQGAFKTLKAMDAEGVSIEVPLNRAIGAYTELINLPKEVLPEANLKALQNAYRAYEANGTPENTTALMQEVRASIRMASKAMGTGVTVDTAVAETVLRLEAIQGYIDRVWVGGDNGGVGAAIIRLPNVEKEKVDTRKVIEYALNPDNSSGGANKARVFESALGFNQSNADLLIQQIQSKLSISEAVIGKLDIYGQRFTVDIPITGANGNTAIVRTGWILEPGATVPRMATIFVK